MHTPFFTEQAGNKIGGLERAPGDGLDCGGCSTEGRRPTDGAGVAGVVLTERGGYALRAGAEWVDVRRFERLAADGRRALAGGQAATAAATPRPVPSDRLG